MAIGQELLELGRDAVATRQLAALVHQRRGQRIVFHVAVVTGFERADQPLQLLVALDLVVDLGQERAILFAQLLGREDQPGGGADALERGTAASGYSVSAR